METHVVDASGQRWKLMTLHFASVVAGVLMAYSLWRIDQLEAGRFALLMGAGVVIGLAAFVCAAVRCAAQAVVRLGFGVPSVASPRTPGTFGSRR
jgi:hypothetical protein